jgi:glucokinase
VKPILAFDIGGTHFRCAIVDGNQIKELRKQSSPSFYWLRSLSGKELVDKLVHYICQMIESLETICPDLEGVALAVPGVVTDEGVVVSAPPLWGNLISDVPLQSAIQARTHHRVAVFNDLCGTALFYSQLSRFSEGATFLMVITLSTGVGCKTVDVKQGRLLLDVAGLCGEIGHVVVDSSDSALVCDCGGRGHLSSYLSGRGLAQFLRSNKSEPLSFLQDGDLSVGDDIVIVQKFAQAVRQGDLVAWGILDFVAAKLAYLIHVISGTFGVDRYILVGPVAYSLGEDFRLALTRQLQNMGIWKWEPSKLMELLQIGIPDDDIGLLGTALYGLTRLRAQARSNA